jgi:hypothetical protein
VFCSRRICYILAPFPSYENEVYPCGRRASALPALFPCGNHRRGNVRLPHGAIANRDGGTFWDFKNTTTAGHDGTASTSDNVLGSPSVVSSRLSTNETSAKREFNGPTNGFGIGSDEENSSFTDGRVNQVLYIRTTFTTGATLPNAIGPSTFDFDGDGATNEGEFFAGTGVTNPQSVFRVCQFVRNGNTVNTTFPTVVGRDYILETSPDLVTWTAATGTFSGTGSAVTLSYSPVNSLARFFTRVRVVLRN